MARTPQELPWQPGNQRFVAILAGTAYNFRTLWNDAGDACYNLDIGDANGVPILTGLPLLTGVDLLDQYQYLGFGGRLVVTTDRGSGEVPSYDSPGTTAHLFFIPDA